MSHLRTLSQREFTVFFYSPIAYIVIAVFLVVSGIFFVMENFRPGQEASLRFLFGQYMPYILIFIVPMLTMRLMSEEFRSGTIEQLMTAPVSDMSVILGKFIGTMGFFVVLLLPTLLYVVLIAAYGDPDVGMILSSYFGLLLLGALFVAVGLFFSTCTQNQVIAVVCSFVLLAIFTFLANYLAAQTEGLVRVVLQHLSIPTHYNDFAKGLVDTNHLVFFVTTTAFFLFLAAKMLESRRWR